MQHPKYSNPKVPEGISSGHEHPLADVAKSSAIVAAFFVLLLVAAYAAIRLLAPHVPFSWEVQLAESWTEIPTPAVASPKQRYLSALAARVAEASEVPEDMVITVHYVEGDVVNAFATFGGHIVVYDGLLRLLDSENAVAMLLGHEIAHIKNRDPIRSAGTALVVSLALGILVDDLGLVETLFGMGNLVTAQYFSREQESEADIAAAQAVFKLYGHIDGAVDLFERLKTATKSLPEPPTLLASHPELQDRVADIRARAREMGWPLEGAKTPRP